MAQAKNGDKVNVSYTGKLKDGTEFDSCVGKDPLQFQIGENKLIPGFEQAVIGMSTGDSKTIQLSADEAYGQHREELVLVVDQDQLPPDLEPKVGEELELSQGEDTYRVRVTEVTAEKVTLDANHPLAGEDLIFDIELLEIV
jgi:peptidylprolyl isomerase